jgi:hypothetical protein
MTDLVKSTIVTLSPSIVSNCLGQPFNKVAGASGNLGVNGTGVEHPVIKNANIMNITYQIIGT